MTARLSLFAAGAVGLAFLFVAGAKSIAVREAHSDYAQLLAARSVPERQATDVVSAINFDYRGFDTLAEEFILFASVLAVSAILRKQPGEEEEDDDARLEPRQENASDAVRILGVAMVPLTALFGLYMISSGAVSPGGGFQGGVIVATAPMLVYLCAHAKEFLHIAPPLLVKAVESAGSAGFVLIGCAALFWGKAFLTNVVPLGKAGDSWSGGTILLLNVAVGCAVAAGFIELLASFVEEVIRQETK
jgi:multicomponent Na+:H+ antiporter subunit B